MDSDEKTQRQLEEKVFPLLDRFFRAKVHLPLRSIPYGDVCTFTRSEIRAMKDDPEERARAEARAISRFLYKGFTAAKPTLSAGDCFMLPNWCRRYRAETLERFRQFIKTADSSSVPYLRAKAVVELDESVGLHKKAARTGLIAVYFGMRAREKDAPRLSDTQTEDELASKAPPPDTWNFCVLLKAEELAQLELAECLAEGREAQCLEPFTEYVTLPEKPQDARVLQYKLFAITGARRKKTVAQPPRPQQWRWVPKGRASSVKQPPAKSKNNAQPPRPQKWIWVPKGSASATTPRPPAPKTPAKTRPRGPKTPAKAQARAPVAKIPTPEEATASMQAEFMKARREAMRKKYRAICAVH